MMNGLAASLGLVALASLLPGLPAQAQASDANAPQRLIWLSGHGEVTAKPDIARITLGVTSQARSAREAVSANNAAMQKVIAALKSAGIAAADIQTSDFSVSARYTDEEGAAPRIAGYEVANTLSLTIRDLAKLGSLLDDVVSEGSNAIHGIAFDINDRTASEDEARKRAVADARRKAGIYAAAAGIKLGRVMAISEGGGAPPIPIVDRMTMKAEAAPMVPVAEGEQTVAIDVNIAWEID